MVKEFGVTKGGLKKLPELTMKERVLEVKSRLNLDLDEEVLQTILHTDDANIGEHILNQDRNVKIGNVLEVRYKFQKERLYKERSKEGGTVADVGEVVIPEHFKTTFSSTTLSKYSGRVLNVVEKHEAIKPLYDFKDEDWKKDLNYYSRYFKYNYIINEKESLEETWDALLHVTSLIWRNNTQRFTLLFNSAESLHEFKIFMNDEIIKYKEGFFEGNKERNIKLLLNKDKEDVVLVVKEEKEEEKKEESVGNE